MDIVRDYTIKIDIKELGFIKRSIAKFTDKDLNTDFINVDITNGGNPIKLDIEKDICYAVIKKPAGEEVLNDCKIVGQNIISVDLKSSAFHEAGEYILELRILSKVNKTVKIVLPAFSYNVFKTLDGTGSEEAKNKLDLLDKALIEINGAKNEVTELVDSIHTGESSLNESIQESKKALEENKKLIEDSNSIKVSLDTFIAEKDNIDKAISMAKELKTDISEANDSMEDLCDKINIAKDAGKTLMGVTNEVDIAKDKAIAEMNSREEMAIEKIKNTKGLIGPQGPQGKQGPVGPAGKMPNVILKETNAPKRDELYIKKINGGLCTNIDKDGYFILNGTTTSTFEVTKAGTIGIKVECLVETPNVYYSFNKYNGESIQPWSFSIKEYAYTFNKGDKFNISLSMTTPATWRFKFVSIEDTKICLGAEKEVTLATMDDIKNRAGKEGPQGPKGENGASAYQIAAKNGYKGTEAEWIASLKGVAGPAGATPTEIDWSKVINKTFDFEQTYISNADMFIKNGYAKTNSDTLKLPPGLATWGVIQGIFENLGNHTGIQYWYPCSGVKKGRVFIRMIETAIPTEWIEVATMKDLEKISSNSSSNISVSKLADLTKRNMFKMDQIIQGKLFVERDKETIKIMPETANDASYIGLYKDGFTRSGVIGHESSFNDDIVVAAEASGANVNLKTNGGKIQANGKELATKEDLANVKIQSGGTIDLTIKPKSNPLPYEPYLEVIEPGEYNEMNTSTYDMPTIAPAVYMAVVSKVGAFKVVGVFNKVGCIPTFELTLANEKHETLSKWDFAGNFEHIINLNNFNSKELFIMGASSSDTGWSIKLIPYRYETIAMNTATEKLTFIREDEDLKSKTQQLQAQVQQLTSVLNTILPSIYNQQIENEIKNLNSSY